MYRIMISLGDCMGILKADNLTKIYGNNSIKGVALDNVSFSIKKC